MKTFRFIGIALLTVLMSVSFSACGGSDDDVDNGGGSPASIEGTWHLNTFKFYEYYYIEDGRKSDEEIVYVDGKMVHGASYHWGKFEDDEIWILTKDGENIKVTSPSQGTCTLEKPAGNEYLYIKNKYKTQENKEYHRVVIKKPSNDELIIEWYDKYYEDERRTKINQKEGDCSLGIFTFYRE
jgi:hypothetical protein